MIIDLQPTWLVPLAILIGVIVTYLVYRDRRRVQAEERASDERREIRERLVRLEARFDSLIGWVKSIDQRQT